MMMHRILRTTLLAWLAGLFAVPVLAADYRLGERLSQGAKAGEKSTPVLRELRWEELVPADWNPKDLLKGLPTVQVRAGYFDGATMDAKCVDMVSSLPSREDLLAQLLSTLIEGPRQLVSVIQAPARDLVQLLKNYEDKLTEAEQAASSAS